MEVEATQPLVETSSAEDEKICQGCPGTHVLSFPIQLPFMVNGPYPAHHEYGEKFIANPRADQLYGAIQLGLVYYDPEAQRGGLPYCMNQEPPSKRFPFDPTKVEAMAEKLEKGILFGDHLTWNLRPGGAHWWYDRKTNRLWVDRTSKIFLPDSHHRHRAVFLVCEKAAKGGSRFRADSKTFTLDIFMMSIEGEQALFHEFNVEGKKADRTRAFYIVPSSWDDAKGVAKELLSISPFYNNVEVIRNRLSKNSSNVITFATLRDGIADNATKVSPVDIDPASGEKKVSSAAVEFYRTWFDRVATVRHELRPTTIVERQQIRQTSLVDQGIVWRAYFRFAAEYFGARQMVVDEGPEELAKVDAEWDRAIKRLGEPFVHEKEGKKWKGDLFSRENPVWKELTVMTMTKKGKWQVNNTRDAREHVYMVLKQHMGV